MKPAHLRKQQSLKKKYYQCCKPGRGSVWFKLHIPYPLAAGGLLKAVCC
ncbi:mCG146863 [Mus musculus]|nr:mCG146863 [Mus musculus]